MRITVPVPNPARAGAPCPEFITVKYGAASEGGRSVLELQFKDKRKLMKGDRDTEVSDFNRLKNFWTTGNGPAYVAWINAFTLIVGRGEPPEIPPESFAEGNAANRAILNWVESRCMVVHMESQGGVDNFVSYFPYPTNMPPGTDPMAGWNKKDNFVIGLKTQPGYVEPEEQADAALYTRDGLKPLKAEALADLAVRNGIVDAVPTWGRDRLISEILAAYKKSIEANTSELVSVK